MDSAPLPTILNQQLMVAEPASGYSCGDCSACCTVLAVTELKKPMRMACDHLCRDGCRIYADRPAGCRQFNCLWLRGAIRHSENPISADGASDVTADLPFRPDHFGVIWDYFVDRVSGQKCLVAFEVYSTAFQRPDVSKLLSQVCESTSLRLSFRNGSWAEVSDESSLQRAIFCDRE